MATTKTKAGLLTGAAKPKWRLSDYAKSGEQRVADVISAIDERIREAGLDSLTTETLTESLWTQFQEATLPVEFETESDRLDFFQLAAPLMATAYIAGNADGMYWVLFKVFGDPNEPRKVSAKLREVHSKLMKEWERLDRLTGGA
jgi:hypothetical protein